MTWLIAEDEADIRNLIAMMCQVWGHTPQTFESGQKVWEWLDTLEASSAKDGAKNSADGDVQNAAKPETETNTQPAQAMPELVLMDIRMPGKKGNEVAQRMRTLPQFAKTPIVLMTAYSLSESERDAMINSDGVDHIMSKPLPDFEEMRAILHGIVERKQKNDTSTPTE